MWTRLQNTIRYAPETLDGAEYEALHGAAKATGLAALASAAVRLCAPWSSRERSARLAEVNSKAGSRSVGETATALAELIARECRGVLETERPGR